MVSTIDTGSYLYELKRQHALQYIDCFADGTPYVRLFHSIRYKFSIQPEGQECNFIQIYPGNWVRFFCTTNSEDMIDYMFKSTISST